MRMIEFLVKRWINLEEMFKKELKKEYSYYCHIEAYLVALTYLGRYDPLIDKKTYIFNKFLNSTGKQRDQLFSILLKYREKEDLVIIEALRKCEIERIENKNVGVGTLWRPFTIGVLFYEYEVTS